METNDSKLKTALYWVMTSLLFFGMFSGGIGQLFRLPWQMDGIQQLGYPLYFLSIIGLWKILGAIAIMIPRFPLLKEWAYAGIVFAMTGASLSHYSSGDSVGKILVPLVFAALSVGSWVLRPVSRRLV